MMTSDDKVGGWVKKGQNHDDVILEWSLIVLKFFLSLYIGVYTLTKIEKRNFWSLSAFPV